MNNINLMIEEFYKSFYQIEEVELKRDIKCLTMNEFHTIDTIGNEVFTMNELADNLSVTMGTATVTIENLVKKNFVKRDRNRDDRRKVFVSLTKKGNLALENHKKFHKKMADLIIRDLTSTELQDFMGVFTKLHKNLSEALLASQPHKLCDFPENTEIKITNVLGSRGLKDFFYKEHIKIGTILRILKINKDNLLLLVEGKELELDKIDSYNLMATINL